MLATELQSYIQVCRPSFRVVAISFAGFICGSLIVYYTSNLIVECNRQEALIFVTPPVQLSIIALLIRFPTPLRLSRKEYWRVPSIQ